jgi:hypothetical protein
MTKEKADELIHYLMPAKYTPTSVEISSRTVEFSL